MPVAGAVRIFLVAGGHAGAAGAALLATLSFLTAPGMLAVAAADPQPAEPALGAFVLVGAGVARARAAAGRTVDRSGPA